MTEKTPRGLRLHIGIFGKRNVGKSSLINAITNQSVSIVDETPGTTTDIVSKPMELKPLGPVLFLDTAGIDDQGQLGKKRVEKSIAAIDRIDLGLLVCEEYFDHQLDETVAALKKRNIPIIIVLNKSDIHDYSSEMIEELKRLSPHIVVLSALNRTGIDTLRKLMVKAAPNSFFDQPAILADLVSPGDMVIMVVPIDLEAPKGRLIVPQVQVLRELLDCDAKALVVKERELLDAVNSLKQLPRLVITDSQAILKVTADIPESVPVTGFSVLFARWKGDLETFVEGLRKIDQLHSGDRILMLESCTHHPIEDDIGRVKIPRWLRHYVGKDLHFDHYAGHDLPKNLSTYQLIIHCGSCMGNRQEMLSRILYAKEAGVPITNYGLVIAKSLGVLNRMLSPFPHLQALAE